MLPVAPEILEVGAGVGQNLPALARLGALDAIEVNPEGAEAIDALGVVRSLYRDGVPFELDRLYDLIVAADVVEHLPDDRAALRWIADRLRPGGALILTVPAYQWLFGAHDRALGHYRRYSRPGLVAALPPDLEVLRCAYFNQLLFPAAVGSRLVWTLSSRRADGATRKQPSPRGSAVGRALGRVLGTEVRWIGRGYRPAWGLSVFCLARKH